MNCFSINSIGAMKRTTGAVPRLSSIQTHISYQEGSQELNSGFMVWEDSNDP
jgi:hypothetical protein